MKNLILISAVLFGIGFGCHYTYLMGFKKGEIDGFNKGYDWGYATADKWCTTWINLDAKSLKTYQEKNDLCREIVRMVNP